MCDIFNQDGYWERLKSGDLAAVVLDERHPAFPDANEPFCTWSRSISYRDKTTNQEMARVHQYDRPDGTIGASGRPDPKRLLKDGILYRLVKKTAG